MLCVFCRFIDDFRLCSADLVVEPKGSLRVSIDVFLVCCGLDFDTMSGSLLLLGIVCPYGAPCGSPSETILDDDPKQRRCLPFQTSRRCLAVSLEATYTRAGYSRGQ